MGKAGNERGTATTTARPARPARAATDVLSPAGRMQSFGFTVCCKLPSANSNFLPELCRIVPEAPIRLCELEVQPSMAESIRVFSQTIELLSLPGVPIADGLQTPQPNVFVSMEGLDDIQIVDKMGTVIEVPKESTTLLWAAARPQSLFLKRGCYLASTPLAI